MNIFSRACLGTVCLCSGVTLAADYPGLGPRGDLLRLEIEQSGEAVLVGGNARKQIVVTGVYSSQQRHDFTREVSYTVDHPEVLSIERDGLVRPLADGEATVTASEPSGKSVQIKLSVSSCGQELPVNFKNEIV